MVEIRALDFVERIDSEDGVVELQVFRLVIESLGPVDGLVDIRQRLQSVDFQSDDFVFLGNLQV